MEDGTVKVVEKVRFENNFTYNEKVKKYIDIQLSRLLKSLMTNMLLSYRLL